MEQNPYEEATEIAWSRADLIGLKAEKTRQLYLLQLTLCYTFHISVHEHSDIHMNFSPWMGYSGTLWQIKWVFHFSISIHLKINCTKINYWKWFVLHVIHGVIMYLCAKVHDWMTGSISCYAFISSYTSQDGRLIFSKLDLLLRW